MDLRRLVGLLLPALLAELHRSRPPVSKVQAEDLILVMITESGIFTWTSLIMSSLVIVGPLWAGVGCVTLGSG
jgi:hypothetical protein